MSVNEINLLQAQNEGLKKQNRKLQEQIADLNYYISCVKTNYEGARGAMEQILKRNTVEEMKYYASIGLMYMDMRKDTIQKFSEEE